MISGRTKFSFNIPKQSVIATENLKQRLRCKRCYVNIQNDKLTTVVAFDDQAWDNTKKMYNIHRSKVFNVDIFQYYYNIPM